IWLVTTGEYLEPVVDYSLENEPAQRSTRSRLNTSPRAARLRATTTPECACTIESTRSNEGARPNLHCRGLACSVCQKCAPPHGNRSSSAQQNAINRGR
ncbi:unnamed protein product, partial [Rhizoctonia solani]